MVIFLDGSLSQFSLHVFLEYMKCVPSLPPIVWRGQFQSICNQANCTTAPNDPLSGKIPCFR